MVLLGGLLVATLSITLATAGNLTILTQLAGLLLDLLDGPVGFVLDELDTPLEIWFYTGLAMATVWARNKVRYLRGRTAEIFGHLRRFDDEDYDGTDRVSPIAGIVIYSWTYLGYRFGLTRDWLLRVRDLAHQPMPSWEALLEAVRMTNDELFGPSIEQAPSSTDPDEPPRSLTYRAMVALMSFAFVMGLLATGYWLLRGSWTMVAALAMAAHGTTLIVARVARATHRLTEAWDTRRGLVILGAALCGIHLADLDTMNTGPKTAQLEAIATYTGLAAVITALALAHIATLFHLTRILQIYVTIVLTKFAVVLILFAAAHAAAVIEATSALGVVAHTTLTLIQAAIAARLLFADTGAGAKEA